MNLELYQIPHELQFADIFYCGVLASENGINTEFRSVGVALIKCKIVYFINRYSKVDYTVSGSFFFKINIADVEYCRDDCLDIDCLFFKGAGL